MTYNHPLYVLFVCTGNICRSPLAQGLLEAQLIASALNDFVRVDSAATHAYQIGSPPAELACTIAAEHGIDISGLRARTIERKDFFSADYIAAMDRFNLQALHAAAPPSQAHKIQLLLDYTDRPGLEIDDPYGQPLGAYRKAFGLIRTGVTGLLQELQRRV